MVSAELCYQDTEARTVSTAYGTTGKNLARAAEEFENHSFNRSLAGMGDFQRRYSSSTRHHAGHLKGWRLLFYGAPARRRAGSELRGSVSR